MSDFWCYADELTRQNLRVCYYGPTRAGKTHSASTWPKSLFIFPKNENSEETLRGRTRTDGSRLPFVRVGSMADMDRVLDLLLGWQRSGQIRDYCETVVGDSLSHYAMLVEQECTTAAGAVNWLKYTAHFKRMWDIFSQLDVHVIVSGLSDVKTDKDQKVIRAGLKMAGQVGSLILSSCDLVVYFAQLPGNQPVWVGHVKQVDDYAAGTRIQGMPHGSFPNFNFTQHVAPYLTNGNGQTK